MADRLIEQLKTIERSPDLWDRTTATVARERIEGLERENATLKIERDNLDAAREWAINLLYPYVLRQAGPLPVPLERIAGLAAQRIDELAQQVHEPTGAAAMDIKAGVAVYIDGAGRVWPTTIPPPNPPHHQDCVSVSEKDAFFQTKTELHPKDTPKG